MCLRSSRLPTTKAGTRSGRSRCLNRQPIIRQRTTCRGNLNYCIETEPSSTYLRPLHNQNQWHVTPFVSRELDDYAPSFSKKSPLLPAGEG